MKGYEAGDGWELLIGDCCNSMRACIADQSIQMCVTSPPYYGLRDYGHAEQLGLEETPEKYISAMVEVFREVKRVLKDDGVLWLNIGDSYASYRDGKATPDTTRGESTGTLVKKGLAKNRSAAAFSGSGIKHKDLIGIPWMLAFALRADGWYLRQDIIWHKPNPMPESVTDRCTKAHEYVFLLSKSERYYFDNEAIKEPVAASSIAHLAQDTANQAGSNRVPGKTNGPMRAVGGSRSKRDGFKRDMSKREAVIPGQTVGTHRPDRAEAEYDLQTRNRRSVWNVATRPYKGAHFATFPPALIEPCILAGSKTGDTILDPFMGSGTTAQVALQHGRKVIGCELNAAYVPLMLERINSYRGR